MWRGSWDNFRAVHLKFGEYGSSFDTTYTNSESVHSWKGKCNLDSSTLFLLWWVYLEFQWFMPVVQTPLSSGNIGWLTRDSSITQPFGFSCEQDPFLHNSVHIWVKRDSISNIGYQRPSQRNVVPMIHCWYSSFWGWSRSNFKDWASLLRTFHKDGWLLNNALRFQHCKASTDCMHQSSRTLRQMWVWLIP